MHTRSRSSNGNNTDDDGSRRQRRRTQRQQQRSSIVEREYVRKIEKPKDVDHTKLRSTLTTDGILVVEAPMPPASLNLRNRAGSASPRNASVAGQTNGNGGGGGGGGGSGLRSSSSVGSSSGTNLQKLAAKASPSRPPPSTGEVSLHAVISIRPNLRAHRCCRTVSLQSTG